MAIMSDKTHALLAPSSAHIWGTKDGCSAYPTMMLQYPEDEWADTSAAEEGDLAHTLAEKLVKHFFGEGDHPEFPNDEMRDAAYIYAMDIVSAMPATALRGLETKVAIWDIHRECDGTTDGWSYDQTTGHLIVWDFKYGRSKIEVFEFWQGICYAAGLTAILPSRPMSYELRVIQPRAHHKHGPIRSWKVTPEKLAGYLSTMAEQANVAIGPKAALTSGRHCKHCRIRHRCPAALDMGVGIYEVAEYPMAADMSPEQLGAMLTFVRRALAQFKLLDTGLSAQVEALAKSGVSVPNWTVESGQTPLKWTVDTAQIIELGDMMGVDVRKPQETITPTQAITAGIPKEIMANYSSRYPTPATLTEVTTTDAKRIFS